MFDHIVSDPRILGGKPCVKGTRISVEFLLELAAQGASREEILKAYPHLTAEGVEQAPAADRCQPSGETRRGGGVGRARLTPKSPLWSGKRS